METSVEFAADGWTRSALDVVDTDRVEGMEVFLEVEHGNIGDLIVNVVTELDDGSPAWTYLTRGWPCDADGVQATFTDRGVALEGSCTGDGAVLTGTFAPVEPLTRFDGLSVARRWLIDIRDERSDGMDEGVLERWCLIY